MIYYVLKVAISAGIIVAVTEVAKRSPGVVALIAALPVTSLLALVWLRYESGTNDQVATLAMQIFWLVIPSLGFFVSFWWLLTHHGTFVMSLVLSLMMTMVLYVALLPVLRKLGVQL